LNIYERISRISPNGVRTVVYEYSASDVPYVYGVAVDPADNMIVTEFGAFGAAGHLSKITPDGVRSIIYTYEDRLVYGVAIDSSGNYIVVEHSPDESVLSRVTPTGDYDVIYAFPADTIPHDVAVDPQGNYIVTEPVPGILSMISASGAETVIFRFAEGTSPMGVAIESTRPPAPGLAAGGIVVLMMVIVSVGVFVAVLPALIAGRGRRY